MASLTAMQRVLITGMSGTGKSSVIRELAERGYKAVDTDWNPDWETPPEAGSPHSDGAGWVWREDRISELLAVEDTDVLFVSGCVPNQSRFYPRFDHIVLLTASPELTIERLAGRTDNAYGKSAEEVAEVLRYKSSVEPMLRSVATEEIDTATPQSEVVERILELTGS
jgi:shikimate kinase